MDEFYTIHHNCFQRSKGFLTHVLSLSCKNMYAVQKPSKNVSVFHLFSPFYSFISNCMTNLYLFWCDLEVAVALREIVEFTIIHGEYRRPGWRKNKVLRSIWCTGLEDLICASEC